MLTYQQKKFCTQNQGDIIIPYITPPIVSLNGSTGLDKLDSFSEQKLNDYFKELRHSLIYTQGVGIIFGTFDNLHLGHKSMLNAAKNLCSELYIGIEDQQTALVRKNFKHPIQDNGIRRQQLINQDLAKPENIFVRKNALDDIKNLQKRGKRLSILFVGESQNDNPEIIDALQYCLQHRISVIAITRLKTKDNSIEISSSAIHKIRQNNIGR